jgi:hypothetical protein
MMTRYFGISHVHDFLSAALADDRRELFSPTSGPKRPAVPPPPPPDDPPEDATAKFIRFMKGHVPPPPEEEPPTEAKA